MNSAPFPGLKNDAIEAKAFKMAMKRCALVGSGILAAALVVRHNHDKKLESDNR